MSLSYDDLPLIWKLVLIKVTHNTEIITAMTKAEVSISGSFSPLPPARPLLVVYSLHGLQKEGWHLSHSTDHFLLGEFGHKTAAAGAVGAGFKGLAAQRGHENCFLMRCPCLL